MNRLIFGLLLLAFAAGAAFAQPVPGRAGDPRQAKAAAKALEQQPDAAAALPSEAELNALIETLQNDAEREKFIETLKALQQVRQGPAAKQERQQALGARVLDYLSDRVDRFSRNFVTGARSIIDLPNGYHWLVEQASKPAERGRWFEIAWKVSLALVMGFAAEWLVRTLLARPRMRLEARESDEFLVKAPSLAARTVLDIIPVGGFLAGSYATLSLVEPGEPARLAALALINANVLVRVIMAVARMILAPAVSGLRLVPLDDEDSNYLFIWTRRFSQVWVYGYGAIAAAVVLGLPEGGGDSLFKVLGLFVTLMAVVFILQNRGHVARRLRGESDAEDDGPRGAAGRLRARLADIWHVPAVLYVIALYGVWALAIEDGFEFLMEATLLTLAIVVVAKLLILAFNRAARRVFSLRPDISQRYPGLEARANRYLPILEKSAAAVVSVVAAFAVLEAWGIDSFHWVTTPFGQRVTGSFVTLAVLMVITVVLWELISVMIERYLSRDGVEVSARAKTLLPLLRTTTMVVLVTMVVMVALSEFGLNIGPLLAGAGVVGLAIGFGAQTLVKDIITGLFILVEDHISVGDVVKVGSHAGVVERLSLRTIQLRDLGGVVHVVPFSDVTTLENMTKDFSRYVFDVGVAYREDPDQVIEVLKALGEEMREDPAYADDILEPLDVLGVDRFGDNAVVIRARITTRPIKQWGIGREFNRRMKKRFDELGIEIPFPHRTLYFGEDKTGNAPPARIATVEGEAYRKDGPVSPTLEKPRTGGTPISDSGTVGSSGGD